MQEKDEKHFPRSTADEGTSKSMAPEDDSEIARALDRYAVGRPEHQSSSSFLSAT